MPDLIGQRLGNYEILSLLGEGGMAAVYRARQLTMRRDVAVKVIESRLARNPDFLKRFEREANTVAELSHAHILKVFDYGQQGDAVYLVMELLRGGSLAERILAGRLPLGEIDRILEQLASALDYAHRRGIVHRDLKPQNVLFDDEGNPYLTDFGIAKVINETTALTQRGVSMGTPAYMSPEQCRGSGVDGRSDVYALGVMLFEMLAGRVPFQGDTPVSMVYMHLHEPPPKIRSLRPELPFAIESVLERALAKGPDQRFQTAGELAKAFRLALAGQLLSEIEQEADSDLEVEWTVPRPATEPSLPSLPFNGQRRTGILAIGAVAMVGVIGVLALLLSTREGVVVAETVTLTPTEPEVVVLAPTVSLTETVTPDIQATARAEIYAEMTQTATLWTLTPTESHTPTPDSAATINAEQTITARQAQSGETADALVIASSSRTPTATPSATPTPTAIPTSTITPFPTLTASWTSSVTPTPSSTATRTSSPTQTSSPAASATPTLTPSVTASTTATLTGTPSITSTMTPITVSGAQGVPPLDDPRRIIDAAIADLGLRLNRTLARGLSVQFGWTWQEFPDTSLGCPQPGQVYASIVTPGFIIELTLGSAVYDYRATQDGTLLFPCGLRDAQGTPQPLDLTSSATPTAPVFQPVSYDPALAYIGQDGNVYVTALSEGPGTPLTGDANGHTTQEFPFFDEDRDYGLLRWSPDGTRLLFVDRKDGTLYLAVSGKAPIPVARGLESGLPAAWSPDGAEFVVAVHTDVTVDGGAYMVQLQAFPADGGVPRVAGGFARTSCGSQVDDAAWALYQDETGPAGGWDVFAWTTAGYVHTLGCSGEGLGLTDFDNLTVWETDVIRAVVSPDSMRAVAIRPGAGGTNDTLVIIDLLTGQPALLDTQSLVPERLAWSADGTHVLFSVSGGETTVSGSADSAVGATMFPVWPLTARTRTHALWRVPAGGGQTQLLTPDLQGYGIGVIAAGPGNDIVLFSVVGSSAPMIELINSGADATTASAAAPHVAIWFVEIPGGFNELQVGGQPVFGAAFSALPAFLPPTNQGESQAVVCEGALPARLTVGSGARVLPAAAVNLREFANSQASRVDVIPAGASIDVVGGPVCDSGLLWWQVEYRGQRGWAAESLGNSYLLTPRG